MIEELDRLARSNPQAMYDEVRKMTGRLKRGQAFHCIEDKEGAMIIEKYKILKRWEEYLKELFDDDKGDKPRLCKQSGFRQCLAEIKYCCRWNFDAI